MVSNLLVCKADYLMAVASQALGRDVYPAGAIILLPNQLIKPCVFHYKQEVLSSNLLVGDVYICSFASEVLTVRCTMYMIID